ncbi:hypothetical protein KAFR_0C04060 [Kazachstania africana CBS 2517]|uniref:Uncharacterized protein n=1 Tax=Kazachstania africana (strain ATCC 22294 / BCRC 22015 / CBS 2517 / CECT 1963 / NBRC 1671 / NRRL Y-8276) TaxID=1071382 RepID=H2ASP7_KAZAF|nr:hypothetical protein KAFR_0C04060 [Kazachstania africana CBS 2517]CCF57397.1 hypothetical protein KAFR_0C04060 [Kazachstania africana CBS 2517]
MTSILPGSAELQGNDCTCEHCTETKRHELSQRRSRRNIKRRRAPSFIFNRDMDIEGSNYDVITSVAYLSEKYGLRKTHYISKFIRCIHRKINRDVSRISDKYTDQLSPWAKSKLFLLLVTLSERGGPEYWLDKDEHGSAAEKKATDSSKDPKKSTKKKNERDVTSEERFPTLTERIIQQNINQDFNESSYDENYVFSSIWANFMEGLINHYLEKIIVPHSEMKVCQQLYKPMMKIISLYNEYNELMEKSERNGFLPVTEEVNEGSDAILDPTSKDSEKNDIVTQERLQRAQKLLWQARQDIPKTISKELTLLSEMYSTLSADEQDYELDEFVCCAEEYIELEFLPSLLNVLFKNCGNKAFWKVLLVLEPFFYYIEDAGADDDDEGNENTRVIQKNDNVKETFKPDPRVITLEKICEVAARQKWI